MKNTYFILRHAETRKDPSLHANKWTLSENGHIQAVSASNNPLLSKIDIIISSNEKKAFLTARPIAKKLNKDLIKMSYFDELKRGSKFLSKSKFEKLKRQKLQDLNCNIDGGETANQAIKRFSKGIEILEKDYNNKNILIVSHGTIICLYFSNINKNYSNIYEKWKKLEFCALGVIKNNKIKKDIL